MSEPCPRHPSQITFAQCTRCKRPACEYCLPDGGSVCSECLDADEGQAAIPWERDDLGIFTRFLRTVSAALTRPTATFDAMRPAPVWRALVFAALMHLLAATLGVLLVAPVIAMQAGGAPEALAGLICVAVAVPPSMVLGGVLWALLIGALFHLPVVFAGGSGGFGSSLRAACYAQVFVLFLPLFVISGAPLGLSAHLAGVGFLIQLVYLGAVFGATARGPHALIGTRARLAGWTPSAALLVLALSLALFAYAVSGAFSPTYAPDGYAPPVAY